MVLFAPMYDAYLPLVKRAGGVARFVTLKPPFWRFDEADLAAVFSSKTKAVLFNNPLNPPHCRSGRRCSPAWPVLCQIRRDCHCR